jgi:hypothetical protein
MRVFELDASRPYTLPAFKERDGALFLKVRAQPGASREGVGPVHGDALKILVTARPEKGKANAAIAKALAEFLGLRGSQVKIHSGETSRDKWFRLEGIALERAREILAVKCRPVGSE